MPSPESKKARRLDAAEVNKIRRDERNKWDDYYQKQLEDQEDTFAAQLHSTARPSANAATGY